MLKQYEIITIINTLKDNYSVWLDEKYFDVLHKFVLDLKELIRKECKEKNNGTNKLY